MQVPPPQSPSQPQPLAGAQPQPLEAHPLASQCSPMGHPLVQQPTGMGSVQPAASHTLP